MDRFEITVTLTIDARNATSALAKAIESLRLGRNHYRGARIHSEGYGQEAGQHTLAACIGSLPAKQSDAIVLPTSRFYNAQIQPFGELTGIAVLEPIKGPACAHVSTQVRKLQTIHALAQVTRAVADRLRELSNGD